MKHTHVDDSGTFDCPIGSACRIKPTPFELGYAAFKRGVKCAPILDVEFMARDDVYSDTLKDWSRGWTKANLEADWEGVE